MKVCPLRRHALREAIEFLEVLRGAIGTEILDQPRADVRVVRDDDERIRRSHRTMMGICSQPRTVEVGDSSMPL